MHRPSGLFLERGGQGRFYVGEIGGALPVNYDVPNIGPRVSIAAIASACSVNGDESPLYEQ